MNGMSYKRRSFTLPASETKETDVCEIRGFHVRSGPAKRRVCQHCGATLPKDCEEQVMIERGIRLATEDDLIDRPQHNLDERRELGRMDHPQMSKVFERG